MQRQPSQQPSASPTANQQKASDAVDRLLRQAEISRLTRNLKSKLALASLKTKSPTATPSSEQRRRAKTLEGALPSPRPTETPVRQRSSSRRASVTSISSTGSSTSMASPTARIPRISSVGSIFETKYEGAQYDGANYDGAKYDGAKYDGAKYDGAKYDGAKYDGTSSPPLFSNHKTQQALQATPQISPQRNSHKRLSPQITENEPLPEEPQTPPSARRSFPKTPERSSTNDGANLLLHFAHSPGRATPRTPDFNMSDYLHFQTPSPARGQLTPRHMRWGSLNSALFQPAGPVSMPRPAGSGFGQEDTA